MKRTMLALAFSGLSLTALAGPPADKPPTGPVDVTVVNTPANPVPVAVMPGMLPTLAVLKIDNIFLANSTGTSYEESCVAIDAPMRVTQFGFKAVGMTSEPYTVAWKVALRPIGGTGPGDKEVAFGLTDSKLVGSYVRALMTVPMNVVTPGYDRLCVLLIAGTGANPVSLSIAAVGEVL